MMGTTATRALFFINGQLVVMDSWFADKMDGMRGGEEEKEVVDG